MKMTFNDWFYAQSGKGNPSNKAWSKLDAVFNDGDSIEQEQAIFEVMKEAWDARYSTLTYKDI